MLNMINQCASVCILNKKDVPSHNQNESETLMEGKKKINNNGFSYVDLGLPSGTLWATCNVGASKPSDFGLYFQWGDTKGYTKEQIEKGKEKEFMRSDYKWSSGRTFTKYRTKGEMLEIEDDAAHANMGGDWHIPTPDQIQELINETTNTLIKPLIGVNGILFTSKTDTSKSIFIPDASYVWGDFIFNSQICGSGNGTVWTSMLSADDVNDGQRLLFCTGYVGLGNNCRYEGLPVRGVIGQIIKGKNNDERRIRVRVKHKF